MAQYTSKLYNCYHIIIVKIFGHIISGSPRFLCHPMAFFDLLQPWDVRELYIWKTTDFPSNSGSAHFYVSWLFDFIFYQKPLYKSLHQSLKSDSHETWKCADQEMERQICCFPYVELSDVPQLQQVEKSYRTAEESRTKSVADFKDIFTVI